MRLLVDNILPPYVFLIVAIIFLATSWYIFSLKRRLPPLRDSQRISSLLVGILSGFYSIFLGFIIYLLWNDYQDARKLVVEETTKLYVLSESTKDFPPQVFATIEKDLTDYITLVNNEEWSSMRDGREHLKAQLAIDKLYSDLISYRPKDSITQLYYQQALIALNQAIEYRNHRINLLNLAIPNAWYMMIFIGAFSILTMSIFLIKDTLINTIMHIFLCIFLAFYVTAVTVLSYPFSGVVSISNEPFEKLLHLIENQSESKSSYLLPQQEKINYT
ncbi:bestrophin-like domain [Legionella hackeliae]|uniref:DUF4239 domain-containing protein n=1 Tax=Legionella hackeliae TaxID=449 RepID=A0A0A8UP75_LEGHA|nr:DUF4239 domain-containing protein [Legionella hackeliae]KTD13931.1 hypothetical protein Lhac_0775 [Legionella hackeliae]CEK10635.1 conserved membrane protein of unknown function [Legionella hackeliae]STX47377.1 Uncharacterised protein [Legionella hackeliae]